MGRRGAHKRQVRLCVCCHSSRGSRARLGFLKCACCGALTHDLPTQALRQEAQAGSCARFAGRGRAAATATQRLPATSGSQHQRAAAGSGSSSSDSSKRLPAPAAATIGSSRRARGAAGRQLPRATGAAVPARQSVIHKQAAPPAAAPPAAATCAAATGSARRRRLAAAARQAAVAWGRSCARRGSH